MRVILKLTILISSLAMSPSFFDSGFIYCGCLSIILFFIMCCDIFYSFKSYINGEFTIDEPKHNKNKLSEFDTEYLNNTYYDNIQNEHKRFVNPMMERIPIVNDKSLDEIIKESCIVKKQKFDIISKIDAPKKEKVSVLSSIKNMFGGNNEKVEEKKVEIKNEIKPKEEKKNKEYIIFANKKGITENQRKVYDEIISLFKSKKYATSRICKFLNAMQHINILKTTIVIYTNETQLDENEIIPKKEIMELLAKKFNMKIQFVKINNVSIFDYYLKTNSIP